jgi:hypothetical protein
MNSFEKDKECFQVPISSCQTLFDDKLITCRESDALFYAIRKLHDNRAGVLVVQADTDEYTIGLLFMSDLVHLVR